MFSATSRRWINQIQGESNINPLLSPYLDSNIQSMHRKNQSTDIETSRRVPYHPSASDFRLRTQESRSWSSFTALGRPSLEGHDTLTGWEQATFDDENYGTYVIGGAYSGYAGTGSSSSSSAREVMAKEELTKRCGFINSPEIIKEMLY